MVSEESKNIDYAKQHHTPQCWLPGKVMYPANSTKCLSWLTCSTLILLMKNVQIYVRNAKAADFYYVYFCQRGIENLVELRKKL